eukprot:934575-Rhodomonas_salina.3
MSLRSAHTCCSLPRLLKYLSWTLLGPRIVRVAGATWPATWSLRRSDPRPLRCRLPRVDWLRPRGCAGFERAWR